MRPLTEERTKLVFEKLTKYIGDNVQLLLNHTNRAHCFRERKDRVFFISENILSLGSRIAPEHLVCYGTHVGKFTKSGKFRLHMTAVHILAPYASYKMWLKPAAEQQFLYGHNVVKGGMSRITENTPQYQGLIVLSKDNFALGFGVAAKNSADCKIADPMATVCFNQADIGQYIRSEDTLL